MTFFDILAHLRADAPTEREKGARFERLFAAWLLADPVRASEIGQVWLWEDFPGRADLGGRDLGIDLVARTHLGEYQAYQCKFYDYSTTVDENAVARFAANSGRAFTDPFTGEPTGFASRFIVSTTESWTANAREIMRGQENPIQVISLQSFADSQVDWQKLLLNAPQAAAAKKPREDQEKIINRALAHFKTRERGRLIMACGTGKTFTSLNIAERMLGNKKQATVLFLVPSIALLNQTLNAWMADASLPIKAVCVCSDHTASRKKGEDEDSVMELALPATTNAGEIARRISAYHKFLAGQGIVAVFSTYQSIAQVHEAQELLRKKDHDWQFDLIICDEAHRTSGILVEEKAFTRIHDPAWIRGKNRLYMTATPKIYASRARKQAKEKDFELCSMDDEQIYGEEIARLGFGFAVANRLLCDYKVLILTTGAESQLGEELARLAADPDNRTLDFDLASRLIGCLNGLAKNPGLEQTSKAWDADPRIMKRAIIFCQNINKKNYPASSMNIASQLPLVAQEASRAMGPEQRRIAISARHIDGSMDAGKRAGLLAWISEDIPDPEECRVLCNVRCLSEGVDVPSLDAAIFMTDKKSEIEVVQSVGRVMRTFKKDTDEEKKFGYIIIPVVIPPNVKPEDALNDGKTFRTVWSVLNALRSHDDTFNAMINSIRLNGENPDERIMIVNPAPLGASCDGNSEDIARDELKEKLADQLTLFSGLRDQLYAKMVEVVGDRWYWERWARDIAPVARNLIARINGLVDSPGPIRTGFGQFLAALQAAINPAISREQAVEMLGQHLITRPVFEALFHDFAFERRNPVTAAMQAMADLLEQHGLAKDTALLEKFYENVRLNLGEIKTLDGRQTVIKNLYDSFFKGAFPKAVEQLGIVYTPVACVDFILRSVDAVLKREFGLSLASGGVNILDPFTGTGTFITRLLQSGLIGPKDLMRKYRHEILCNEIVLLAYYVANVNIESVFQQLCQSLPGVSGAGGLSGNGKAAGKRQGIDLVKKTDAQGGINLKKKPETDSAEYYPFTGITLTDTFQLAEGIKQAPEQGAFMQENIEGINRQAKTPIHVIIGNPPYSAGQKSANDNAQNLKYPALDKRIEQTYVSAVRTTNKNSLYDSYIRAFRWASDRLHQNEQGGVIGFITNGGWLDGNAAAGLRKCLEQEFTGIYVFHLRGDQRTSGELSRREGGKIFGSGSRAPVVITILVYNPEKKGQCEIFYSDIGDYLSREQKLAILNERKDIFHPDMNWRRITPDRHGDWLRQRSSVFEGFTIIGDKNSEAKTGKIFDNCYSNGLKTQRDAWCWNFSESVLRGNIGRAIEFYNSQCEEVAAGKQLNRDPKFFSWSVGAEESALKNKPMSPESGAFAKGLYRPFARSNIYYSRRLNERVYRMPDIFPTPVFKNLVLCVNGTGDKKDFSCLLTDTLPDLELVGKSQCFPLYYYEQKPGQQGSLLQSEAKYTRRDAITDWMLSHVQGRFGKRPEISKEAIFYYVYGLLHSPDYRQRFNDDLKKSLPRIPLVGSFGDFTAFSEAGRALAELHLNYENQGRWPGVSLEGASLGDYHVEKMKFGGKPGQWDKSRIIYNSAITVANIPSEAYNYVVNGRSAIEWIMESYRVKTDKASGIVNDPNKWAEEQGKPCYILDLLLSVISVSMKTLKIVAGLPRLEFGE